MIILMQEQLRTRHELGTAHCQEDAIGAGGRRDAPVKLRVARVLDHYHVIHRFLEQLLECRGYRSWKRVTAPKEPPCRHLKLVRTVWHTGRPRLAPLLRRQVALGLEGNVVPFLPGFNSPGV